MVLTFLLYQVVATACFMLADLNIKDDVKDQDLPAQLEQDDDDDDEDEEEEDVEEVIEKKVSYSAKLARNNYNTPSNSRKLFEIRRVPESANPGIFLNTRIF